MSDEPINITPIIEWGEQKRLFPQVIERLEAATGPVRRLDYDIARVFGMVEGPFRPGSGMLCHDGLAVPRFTAALEDVVAIVAAKVPGSDWTVRETPEIDAQIWVGDASNLEYWDAAYRGPGAEPYMDRPPANLAIAPTLALLRACVELL